MPQSSAHKSHSLPQKFPLLELVITFGAAKLRLVDATVTMISTYGFCRKKPGAATGVA